MSSDFPPQGPNPENDAPQPNPYAAPTGGYQSPEQLQGEMPTRTSMDYIYAYNYVFENQNWIANLLLSALVMFIPIIGGLVALGYHYEIISMILLGRTQTYPDFDFGRFGEYLMRGVWVFLVMLCSIIILVPIIFLLIGMVAIAGSIDQGLGVIVGIVCYGLYFLTIIAFNFFALPLQLRAGLTMDFMSSYDFDFIKDYVSKMWVEQLISMIFLMVSAMVIQMVGYLMLCVGIIPAIALIGLAFAHIQLQLYQVYLSRGGKTIPIAVN